MNKVLLLFSFFVLFSCSKTYKEIEHPEFGEQDIVIDAYGVEYPYLDPSVVSYCGQGWGRKFCRFLLKHDGTIWADAENYYSDFSDIKFSRFNGDSYFISFINLDSTTSYCEGWKLGTWEGTTEGPLKSDIKIKKDKPDEFWFELDYYGSSDEIEYSITYKYEVIDGLLHFSSTEGDGQTFIFHPSDKNYSENFLDTDEIIRLEGCLF